MSEAAPVSQSRLALRSSMDSCVGVVVPLRTTLVPAVGAHDWKGVYRRKMWQWSTGTHWQDAP